MSFFNWQGITEDLLRVQQNQKGGKRFTLEQLEESSSEQDTDNESEDDADGDFEKKKHYNPLRLFFDSSRRRQHDFHNAPTSAANRTNLAQTPWSARTVEGASYSLKFIL